MDKTFRLFSLVAYDESDTMLYSNIFKQVNLINCEYFVIKHDKEPDTKTHYHIVLYFRKPTSILNISKKLDVSTNYIRTQDDFGKRYTLKNTIGYLIHYNNKDKHNYNVDEIITNNKDLVNKYYDLLTGGASESNNLKEIMLFLDNNPFADCKDLLYFCIENDLLKTFKKYSYYLNQIIKENQYERSI